MNMTQLSSALSNNVGVTQTISYLYSSTLNINICVKMCQMDNGFKYAGIRV